MASYQNFVDHPKTRKEAVRSLWLIDLDNPINKIEIQNIPLSLDYNFDNKLQAIASPGRNNPLYHYTGSEDSLEFELSWYATEQSRSDVIKKCKWLEAMSKNDGWSKPPRMVGLDWSGPNVTVQSFFNEDGSISDYQDPASASPQLFEFSTWLVAAAPYSLSLFHKAKNMLPTLATQKVKLVKVTKKNQTRTNIYDPRY